MSTIKDLVCRKCISFLLILTLIFMFPIFSGSARVNAALPSNPIIDMSKVSGHVTITSDGINIVASTAGGIIASGPAAGGMTITGATEDHQVKVSGAGSSGEIPLTLSDASIILDGNINKTPFELTDSAIVEVELRGVNILNAKHITSIINCNPGLGVSSPNAVSIIGDGSLDIKSFYGAGIGGKGNTSGNGGDGSNIFIGGSASVEVRSDLGAGIGGGFGITDYGDIKGGAGENINISDNADVFVRSGSAGIGGGRGTTNDGGSAAGGVGKNINISSNADVNVRSGQGAGIGGGSADSDDDDATGGSGENINISDNATVNVEASSNATAGIGGGNAHSSNYGKGIGGTGKNINIFGTANITIESENGAGIGGGEGCSYDDVAIGGTGKDINIFEHATVSTFSRYGAGIGGGHSTSDNSDPTGGTGENINISDNAIVTAKSIYAAGIGSGGSYSYDKGNVTGGAGKDINISGDADVTLESEYGAGIGGGFADASSGYATGGTGTDINIFGNAIVNAKSNEGAAIGGGYARSYYGNSTGGKGESINISGNADVTLESEFGAGIGGGYGYAPSGSAIGGDGIGINISGESNVTAIDLLRNGGAGMGGGYAYSEDGDATGGDGKNINISGPSNVTAKSIFGAGIGGGGGESIDEDNTGGIGENINISDTSNVIAGSEYGAGIGGGSGMSQTIGSSAGGSGKNINISDSATIMAESKHGAGIGGAYSETYLGGDAIGGAGQDIRISGGFVTAKSESAHDIGGGSSFTPSDTAIHGTASGIVIDGGSVFADKMGAVPKGAGNLSVYKVTVPAIKTGTSYSLLGNLDISVPLSGATYKAKTVSDKKEHGSDFPADAAAYIYLPAGERAGISAGSHKYGYANVKAAPADKNENIVLWGNKSVNVDFNGNGADEISQTGKTATYGGLYGELPTATRAGYTLDGWFTSTSGEVEITSGSIVSIASNHTLYAIWTQDQPPAPKVYTVTFNVNGGNKLSSTTKKVTYGQKYGTLPTPTKKGNRFLGWYTAKTGGSRITSTTTVQITGNQTLYARWQANLYTITFKANAKKVKKLSPRNKKVAFGSKLGRLPAPKKVGYKLKGWYTKSKGGTRLTRNSVMNYDRNISLYAHWIKNGKIVNCRYAKIKKGPGSKYKTIGRVKKGTKVCIIKKVKKGKKIWYKVKAGSKTGYIYKKYVKYV